MQAWAFLDCFWTPERVQAFLSLIPIVSIVSIMLYYEFLNLNFCFIKGKASFT